MGWKTGQRCSGVAAVWVRACQRCCVSGCVHSSCAACQNLALSLFRRDLIVPGDQGSGAQAGSPRAQHRPPASSPSPLPAARGTRSCLQACQCPGREPSSPRERWTAIRSSWSRHMAKSHYHRQSESRPPPHSRRGARFGGLASPMLPSAQRRRFAGQGELVVVRGGLHQIRSQQYGALHKHAGSRAAVRSACRMCDASWGAGERSLSFIPRSTLYICPGCRRCAPLKHVSSVKQALSPSTY